jgi:hypothetical protein
MTGSQPDLKSLLGKFGLSVLVAPHHGLKSCFSEDLYKAIKNGFPREVIISESRKYRENHGETHPNYQREGGAELTQIEVDGRIDPKRRSVSTKDGHHILVVMNGDGAPGMFAHTNPNYLLTKIKA